jgi:tetratricopeptide (TPR) repeat protein
MRNCKRNGTLYYGGMAIVLLMSALESGCTPTASKQGQAQLTLATKQYEAQDYTLAAHTLTEFIKREGKTQEAPEAYYLRGMCYRYREPPKNDLAEQDFLQAVKKSNAGPVKNWAYVALGHIYFETRLDKQEQAIEYYQTALQTLAEEAPMDAVLYRLGVALQRMGRWEDADVNLSRCFDTFGSSTYAPYAHRHFGARIWRIQFGAFANLTAATKLVSELKSTGWEADWQPHRDQGRLLYIVRGGQFSTYLEAQNDLKRAQATYPDAMPAAVALSKLKR